MLNSQVTVVWVLGAFRSLKAVCSCGEEELRLHALFCPAPCSQTAAQGPPVSLATAAQRLPEGAFSVSPGIPPLAPHCPVVLAWAH